MTTQRPYTHRSPPRRARRAAARAVLPPLAAAAAWMLFPALAADAEEAPGRLPEVVVHMPVLPGTAVAVEDVPGEAHSVDAAELAEDPSGNVAQALATRFAGIGIEDATGDALQPNLVFRGFSASPTLGTPQGLAVYQNGVRLNEAFGEVVNWDLVPTFALQRVDIVGANPVYGANALGGAVVLTTKNGVLAPGILAEAGGASYGERYVTLEDGLVTGPWALYVGGRSFEDDGARRYSGNRVHQLHAELGYARGDATLNLGLTGADNVLKGPGATPVQELAVSRRLIFTGPQEIDNHYGLVSLSGEYRFGPALTLSGVAYYRRLHQGLQNGNTTTYRGCAGPANTGLLCQSDAVTPLATTAGDAIPDLTNGALQPIGENDIESIRSTTRGATFQLARVLEAAGLRQTITVGGALDAADVDFGADVYVGTMDANLRVGGPGYRVRAPQGTAFRATPVRLGIRNRVVAWHATDAITVTPAFTVTASARYARNDINLTDQVGAALTGRSLYQRLNAALGAAYRLTAGPTAFADYAETTRAPSASEIECSDPARPCLLPSSLAGDPPTLRQVVARTWDAGLRQTSGVAGVHGLGFAVSAFRATLRDDIYGVATSAGAGYYTNIGTTRREGLSAEASFRGERWSGFASASLVAATFREAFALPSPNNPYADSTGVIHVQAGSRLPGIPRLRFATGADWNASEHLSVGATVTAVSGSYYHGDESNQSTPLAGYARLDLRSTVRLSPRLDLTLSIHNVLDAHYATYGLYADPSGVGAPGVPSGGIGADPRFQNPAPPLTVRIGLRARL